METKTVSYEHSLSMGALVLISSLIRSTNWSKNPAHKLAAGIVEGQFRRIIEASEPPPVLVPPTDLGYPTAVWERAKAVRAWSVSKAIVPLTPVQLAALVACLQFTLNTDSGTDEFIAELQLSLGAA